jgi:hypothetical protein
MGGKEIRMTKEEARKEYHRLRGTLILVAEEHFRQCLSERTCNVCEWYKEFKQALKDMRS